MKREVSTILLMCLGLALAIAPSVRAAEAGIYGYVDKVQYEYGESGELRVWVVNEGDEALILHSIKVIYPWNAVLPWEGNDTLDNIDEVISVGDNLNFSFDFTVPSDRGTIAYAFGYPDIEVSVDTDKVDGRETIAMNIATPPMTSVIQDMDNLVTLITVQIIVAIISAVIIAAAVFLSGRRPEPAWQKEG